jgi:diguanylate cyclase (GGDEF)-like protein
MLAKRHEANPKPTAVLLIDLDHFKSINDRFGHAIGDRVLETFAETARQCIRSTDLLGRLGGEEFAIVLYNVDSENSLILAEQIRLAFEQATLDVDGRPLNATISIGIVHCQNPVLDMAQLLAQADQALYFAKERGRNRVEVASLNLVREKKMGPGPTAADTPATTASKSAA